MELLSPQFIILVPVVVGLVKVIELTGLKSRYLPLTSLILGVGGAYLLSGFTSVDVIQGLIVGLSASGLWSGVKATIGK